MSAPAPKPRASANHGRDVENLIGDLEFAVADRERIDHEIMKLKRASDVAAAHVKDVRRRLQCAVKDYATAWADEKAAVVFPPPPEPRPDVETCGRCGAKYNAGGAGCPCAQAP